MGCHCCGWPFPCCICLSSVQFSCIFYTFRCFFIVALSKSSAVGASISILEIKTDASFSTTLLHFINLLLFYLAIWRDLIMLRFVIRLYCYFIIISYSRQTSLHFNPWPLFLSIAFLCIGPSVNLRIAFCWAAFLIRPLYWLPSPRLCALVWV